MKHFSPSPDLAYNCSLSSFWENGFSNEELDVICNIGDRNPPQTSLVGDSGQGMLDKKIRISTISWIEPEGWLADKLEYIARQLNGQYFGLDIWGFGESFQYTTYKYNKKSGEQAHYDWHMDQGPNLGSPRKLSIVLQLSDPLEYEGGDLELMLGGTTTICKKQRGLIYAFPSYILHRVTPVTKGTRRTLVTWISGPKFK